MKDHNKLEDKNLKFDTIQIKATRFIKKYESYLSKILYLISLGTFLIESIILSIGFTLEHLLNLGVWIFIIIFGGFFIVTPIYYYLNINKKFNSLQIKSYEMLGTLVLFISSILVGYIPKVTFCAPSVFGTSCSVYPGSFAVGIFTTVFFILMPEIIVSKEGIRINKNLNFESLKSGMENIILDIQKKIELNEIKFKHELESMETSHNYENSVEILGIYNNNLEYYEKLFFRKKQQQILENDPYSLRKMAEMEYKKENFEKGLILSKKAVKKESSVENKRILALNLSGDKQFLEAYNILIELLNTNEYNPNSDLKVIAKILEQQNNQAASQAAKEKDIKKLYELLNLTDHYKTRLKYKIINISLGILTIVIFIYFFWFITQFS